MEQRNSIHSKKSNGSSSNSTGRGSSAALQQKQESIKRRKSVRDRVREPACIQIIKITSYHVALYVGVVLYLFAGAFVFSWVEGGEEQRRFEEKIVLIDEFDTVAQTFANDSRVLGCDRLIADFINAAAIKGVSVEDVLTLDGVKQEYKPESNWDFSSSFLFAFTIATTIGYGNIAPITKWGKFVTIVYGIIGIPLTMIAIADLGKFMVQGLAMLWKRMRGKRNAVDDADRSWLFPLIITFVFWAYILFGAAVLPLWETQWDYGNAVYYCFITLTTVGLGDFVPNELSFLPLTILYIATGLWLTTQTMEVFADILKRVHYAGRKLTNIEDATIWVGGKKMKVRDIIHTVKREAGIPMGVMTDVDWDEAITRTVEEPRRTDPVYEADIVQPVRSSVEHAEKQQAPQLSRALSVVAPAVTLPESPRTPPPDSSENVSAINIDSFPPAAAPKRPPPRFSVHVKVKPTDKRRKSYHYHYDDNDGGGLDK